jgi:hypothetical protein
MDSHLQVGTLVIARHDTPYSELGELGVCCRFVTVEGRGSTSFIFAGGGYAVFRPRIASAVFDITGIVLPSIAGYAFTSREQLTHDYRAGYFAHAFALSVPRSRGSGQDSVVAADK